MGGAGGGGGSTEWITMFVGDCSGVSFGLKGSTLLGSVDGVCLLGLARGPDGNGGSELLFLVPALGLIFLCFALGCNGD